MDEQQKQAFNLAVDLYTDLLFEQKELIFRIIETSYNKGIDTARLQIQAEIQEQLQAQAQQERRPEYEAEKFVEEKREEKPPVRSGIVR